MIRNYLKIALRNLWRNRLFTSINAIGLSLAIGCSLLIFLTSFHQLSFNRFHKDSGRIFRVYIEEYTANGTERSANMPMPLQPALVNELSEIEQAVRWSGSGGTIVQGENEFRVSTRFTDPDFFELFSFKLLEGEPASVLKDINSAVISERVAKRIFKDQSPIGASIRVTMRQRELNLTITGIVEDQPNNSSLNYGLITRFENKGDYLMDRDNWDNFSHEVFVKLPKSMSLDLFSKQAIPFVEKHLNGNIRSLKQNGANPDEDGQFIRLKLQPLHQLHFDRDIDGAGLKRAFAYGLVIIGIFILAIACFNFVNLSLGTSLTRTKEIGIRKVLGANKNQILYQFWGEGLFLVTIAIIIGLGIAQWLLPEYNRIFQQDLVLFQPHIIGAIMVVILLVGLLGGAYPGIVLSKHQAASVLKKSTPLQRPGKMRNLLVLVQFTLSILLIICTIIVYQQINYLASKPLGYDKERVVSLPIGNVTDPIKFLNRYRQEVARIPAVQSITGSYNNLGLGRDGSTMTSIVSFTQDEKLFETHWNPIDYNYFSTLGIPVLEGREFNYDLTADSTRAIIINEKFAEQLRNHFKKEDLVGQVIDLDPNREIVGIVQDFHFQSLQEQIAPISFVLRDGSFNLNYILVRLKTNDFKGALSELENTWKNLRPEAPFLASFLDDNNQRQYVGETMMAKIFSGAAILAIALSCMGLFGIALLIITRRTKEIGIRKILGASVSQIFNLVTWDFMRLVLIALVLASPVAWWTMQQWLMNYAYAIKINWWVFPIAGALVCTIALLTLGWQSVRAATNNPVNTLRDE